MKKSAILLCCFLAMVSFAAAAEIPAVHYNIFEDEEGRLFYIDENGDTMWANTRPARYTLEKLRTMPEGYIDGLQFDFNDTTFNGLIYYGFLHESKDVRHAYPVFFKRSTQIERGKAEIDIAGSFKGKYDLANWPETGRIYLGYRIADDDGHLLYDGKFRVVGKGPFAVDTSIVEGPFVNLLTHNSAVISFATNFPIKARIFSDDRTFASKEVSTHHEIAVDGLQPDSVYEYTVYYGAYRDAYDFRTAPEPGSRKPFTFGYASDCRSNNGGGERALKGVNAYMLKRIAVVCNLYDTRFFQFTGDLIDGYRIDPGEMRLEYANWKRAVEPFASYFPFIAGFGNHESMIHYFRHGEKDCAIDKFPFEDNSSESVFADEFVNPLNGPDSEDGAAYDPDPETIDFPSYQENCFYYSYDNVVVISLNSDYWYSYSIAREPKIGGNPHGYIMDQQLVWLEKVLTELEADDSIDHIFVSVHTPIFPNGGHVKDDMWYSGNNEIRPWVAGKPVDIGIIERRDQLLDLMVNHSTKVRASLTGDEHNYSLLKLTADMPKYDTNWRPDDTLSVSRPIWMINNGAAGAPYYGQEVTPWQATLIEFTTQNALVLFHISGTQGRVEVINPDTFEKLDEFDLIAR